jgi:hypothetical protein
MFKLIIIFATVVGSLNLKAQETTLNKIHHIIIYKIKYDSIKQSNLIKIDAKGKFEQDVNSMKNKGSINNYKVFFKEISALINSKKFYYSEANNNPPSEISNPKKNEQSIYFTIVTEEDIKKSKGFNTGSHFSWGKSNFDLNIKVYDILSNINSKTKTQLLKLLDF